MNFFPKKTSKEVICDITGKDDIQPKKDDVAI